MNRDEIESRCKRADVLCPEIAGGLVKLNAMLQIAGENVTKSHTTLHNKLAKDPGAVRLKDATDMQDHYRNMRDIAEHMIGLGSMMRRMSDLMEPMIDIAIEDLKKP